MILLGRFLLWCTILLGASIMLLIAYYTEETWRGKSAWENCKRKLAAKGDSVDWEDYVPPPVPDGQNFFKAPKMQEWFVKKSGESVTNKFIERLTNTNVSSVVIAEVVLGSPLEKPSASESNALVLRFDESGNSIFLPYAEPVTNQPSAADLCPKIAFSDVPLTTAVEHLARVAGLRYSIDPAVKLSWHDASGNFSKEPILSIRWENVRCKDVLQALLDKYGLQMFEGPGTNAAVIVRRSPTDSTVYASADTRSKIEQTLQGVLGENVIGSQTFAILKRPLAGIRPAHFVLQSEQRLDETKIIRLFTQYFPNSAAKLGLPRIHLQPSGDNSYHVILDAENAADYLAWSGRFKPEFLLIFEALKRPYARIDGDYSNPFGISLPNFAAERILVQTLAQRAQCHLLLGQPDQALAELTLINESRRMFEFRPSGKTTTMVSAMINVAVAGLINDTIADGFRMHAWHEAQLSVLQGQLEQIKLIPFLCNALKGEPAAFCHVFEAVCLGKNPAPNDKLSSLKYLPEGMVYQNMVNAVRLNRMMLDGFDITNDTVSPRICDQSAEYIHDFLASDALSKKLDIPFKLLAVIAVPVFSKAMETAVYDQTSANEAQIACALERYRLAHGEYPETLAALVPQFIAKLPHDIIGGKPFQYRREAGDRFVLYSVGWNETDDGGVAVSDYKGSVDYAKGDWVWKN